MLLERTSFHEEDTIFIVFVPSLLLEFFRPFVTRVAPVSSVFFVVGVEPTPRIAESDKLRAVAKLYCSNDRIGVTVDDTRYSRLLQLMFASGDSHHYSFLLCFRSDQIKEVVT